MARPRTPVKDRRQRQAKRGGPKVTFAIGLLLAFSLAGVAVLVTPFVLAGAAYAYAADALSQLDFTSHEATFQTSRIYDRNGKLLYEFVDPQAGKRTQIPLAQVPESLRDATIAIEDKNFYTNPGFDTTALIRAAYDDLTNHEIVSGASTITQQLVKRVYLTPDQTLQRKLREIAIAYTLSKEKSKDEILEMYLNQIYYGNQAYGIEAAAESYFGKTAGKLDLAESAMLAGLPQSPNEYDPILNYNVAKVRQLEVLTAMVNQGYISEQQASDAYGEDLKAHFANQRTDIQAPHFVFYVRDLLEQKYGRLLYEGGLTIKTTLDLDLQNQAQQIIQDQLAKLPPDKNVNDGALVAMDPKTGQILAMVGSRDYNVDLPNGTMDGKFNATTAPLQPGSSWKPFEYLADFLKGKTPATIVDDTKIVNDFPNFDGSYYRPENYDKKYHGKVTMRTALGNSLNIPAVKVLKDAGIHETLQLAHSMGISTVNDESQVGLSLALGSNEVTPLDLTSAYAVLANGGQKVPPTAILSITDSTGKVIESFKQPQPQEVVKPEYAYLMTSILSDDTARQIEFGRNSVLVLPDRPAAVKTGTTEEFRANWTVGYTPGLVTGVWVGNSNHSAMNNIIGIDGAGPIWHDFMEAALKGKPAEQFVKPPNIVTLRVSTATGLLPNPGEGSYDEVFVKGTEPKTRSTYFPITTITPLSRAQALETTTAVSAYATAYAQGTPLPGGISLTPPAVPTVEPLQIPQLGTPQATPSAPAPTTPAQQASPATSNAPQATPTPVPGTVATVAARPAGNKLVVPSLIGMTQSQAEGTLKGMGLSVGGVTFSAAPGSTTPIGGV
ncbi:MAG: PBP1A family penicillin-binding protein, partial [Chloroflexi bacterium]|nr:PBP1A family penicillin-binding protein [Chloroflexota bacterium]